jgi:hypothetical protein
MSEEQKVETTNNNPTSEQPDLALQVELERAKAERATAEVRAREIEAANNRIVSETAALKLDSLLTAALNQCDIRFHPKLDQLKVIGEHACKIRFSLDGNGALMASRDGLPMDVQRAFDAIAAEASYTTDKSSAGWQRLSTSPSVIKAKSDLKTVEERSRYISEKGLDAFERLPRVRVDASDISALTASQYRALSATQKAEIVQQHGSDAVARILARRG